MIDKYEYAGLQNPVVKLALDLASNRVPTNRGLFSVQGIWALEKVLEFKVEIIVFIFCPELIHSPEAEAMVVQFLKIAPRTVAVSKKVYERFADRDNPDGLSIIGKLPKPSIDDIVLRNTNLIVILDGLEIPGNVGTIIRSVDGAGGDGVVLVNRKVRLSHSKVLKGSHGVSLKVPVIDLEIEQLLPWLEKNRFTIYLTDTSAAKSYYQVQYDGRVAIIAGNEKHGISRKWYNCAHIPISIPMLGHCDSLNVGVATSIVTYEACLKQRGFSREAVGTSGVDSPHSLREKLFRQLLSERQDILKKISNGSKLRWSSLVCVAAGV